jgi:hypothetical protein
MTPEKKSFLLAQLQEAIDEAVSESGRISAVVEEMRRSGYDLCLMLESTVTISPVGDHQSDVVPEPRLELETPGVETGVAGEFELSEADLEFLQEMNIAVAA